MTEEEWLNTEAFDRRHWTAAGEILPQRFTRRHAQRVAAASLPRVSHLLADRRALDAVRYVERLAGGNARWREREYHVEMTRLATIDFMREEGHTANYDAREFALYAVQWALNAKSADIVLALACCAETISTEVGGDYLIASRPFTRILRDVAGNPFRRPRFDWRWRTPTVVGLAHAIHADRAFDRMPILADALEEAGCDDADILTHCRDADGTHVRGCWVLDPILDHG